MIIDVHGHTVAPAELYEYQAKMIARRGPMAPPAISDDVLARHLDGHVKLLDEAGTDVQFISPRPYTMMHSLFNAKLVSSWTRFVNDTIHRQVGLRPDRFRGVAGLPQFRTTDLAPAVEELTRCIEELGFVGCLLNPDPMEGEAPPPPGLGDEYWYPLYERMVELDVPALIHSGSCGSRRESYSLHFINEETIAVVGLLNSTVFDEFPTLRIVVGHGGGAVPYQLGRFRAPGFRRRRGDFADSMRKLHFDTCVYSREGLELLFKVVGPSNCLFGTERPGTGSPTDPATGRALDDLRPIVESIDFLSDQDREQIFSGNARALYARAFSSQDQHIAAGQA